jgi:hypothetical protein
VRATSLLTLVQNRLALLVVLTSICALPVAAQESAALSGDEIVKAGEDFNFTITLDRAPNFDGGAVEIDFTDPDNRSSGMAIVVKSGQGAAHGTFHIPASAVGGKWHVKATGFHDGYKVVRFKQAAELTFQVKPTPGLIYPTSAQVTVNPSQQQFLRKQALRLQDQLQTLKAAIVAEHSEGRIQTVLRGGVMEALKSLDSTETQFRQLETGNPKSEAAKVFFDDLRVSYQDILSQLNKHQLHSQSSGAIVVVSVVRPSGANQAADYPIAAKATFRTFEQNELAYNTVADAQSLIFDLGVTSNPSGAVVSYRKRGDPYRQNPDPTNTVISALPYAIWTIQFQKAGYKTIEREHDPFTAPNHVINVELEK